MLKYIERILFFNIRKIITFVMVDSCDGLLLAVKNYINDL